MIRRLLLVLAAFFATLSASAAHLVLMIGEDEYKTWDTLPEFAAKELKAAGHRVSIVHASKENKNDFPGLVAALRDADLLLVSVRRRTPLKDQLDAVRAHVAAGRAVAGIRTASHGFSPLPKENITDPRLGMWKEFDAAVLGGNYAGHHRGEGRTSVVAAPGAAGHAILRGLDAAKLATPITLYKTSPLAPDATPLLIGTFKAEKPEPMAWTRLHGPKQARVFYTSLGGPEDFANPEFRRFLGNAITWALAKK